MLIIANIHVQAQTSTFFYTPPLPSVEELGGASTATNVNYLYNILYPRTIFFIEENRKFYGATTIQSSTKVGERVTREDPKNH